MRILAGTYMATRQNSDVGILNLLACFLIRHRQGLIGLAYLM